jgi:hypothetical protein
LIPYKYISNLTSVVILYIILGMENHAGANIKEAFAYVLQNDPEPETVHWVMEEAGGDPELAMLITDREQLVHGFLDRENDPEEIHARLEPVNQSIEDRKRSLGMLPPNTPGTPE